MEPNTSDLYHTPAVRPPTQDEIQEIASDIGLRLTEEEVQVFAEAAVGASAGYQTLNKYTETKPPVKYPRCPGYRPPAGENKLNGWFYKSEIKGAPSGKLHGKTFAIKDSVAVAGIPLTNGSRLMEGYTPEFDATVVTRILDAGGVILGKSNCEDMCMDGTSFTGEAGPVLNPHDPTRSAGGSSSGSAVLVASHEVDMAIGGDQAGSIRMPAAWCGIVGLKPTFGLVPYTGGVPSMPSFDYLGPMTRTVKDCALLLEVIAGYDNGLDGRQNEYQNEVPLYSQQLTGNLEGIKLAVVKEGYEGAEEEVVNTVKAAIKLMSSKGALVEEVSIPMHRDGSAIWGGINTGGFYQTLFLNHGICTGSRGFYPSSMVEHCDKAIKTRPNDMPTNLRLFYLFGRYLEKNYGLHHHMKAQNILPSLRAAYDSVLQNYDALVMPTSKKLPHKLPTQEQNLSTTEYLKLVYGLIENTCAFNATGHPALTVNAGFSPSKLPVGVMLVGRHNDEATVLRVAHAFEKIRDEN